jgi:hypothetical protein
MGVEMDSEPDSGKQSGYKSRLRMTSQFGVSVLNAGQVRVRFFVGSAGFGDQSVPEQVESAPALSAFGMLQTSLKS